MEYRGSNVMAKKSSFLLTLGGAPVPVTHEVLPIGELRLNPDNPRIRFLRRNRYGERTLSAAELLDLIREQPGYEGLQKAIRKAGGLHDPVIIRHDGTVVEGNSRTTVYKTLNAGNPSDKRWQQMPVVRLPKTVPEKAVAMLMAGYHIAGKTVWRPYAQADQIYELRHVYDWSSEQIADVTRMTPGEVDKHLEAYEYLVKEVIPHVANGNASEILEKKFHHALEFVKHKKLESKDPVVRKDFAKLLVEGKIKGAEVRKLDKVFKNRRASAALRRRGFEAAEEVLRETDPVSVSKPLIKMKAFTKFLGNLGQKDLAVMKGSQKARQVVIDLHEAVSNVAAIAGVKLKGRNA